MLFIVFCELGISIKMASAALVFFISRAVSVFIRPVCMKIVKFN